MNKSYIANIHFNLLTHCDIAMATFKDWSRRFSHKHYCFLNPSPAPCFLPCVKVASEGTSIPKCFDGFP